uniref:F-box domain-containing protein n=1 Tax=Plectus sambesii TaxID=2011161 RepID=A0A914VVR0_9BILA
MARTYAIADQYELAFNQQEEPNVLEASLVAECCEVDSAEACTSGYVQEPSRPEEARLDPRLKIWWPSTSQASSVSQQQWIPTVQRIPSDTVVYRTAGGTLRPTIRVVRRSVPPYATVIPSRFPPQYVVKSPVINRLNGHRYPNDNHRQQQTTVVFRQRPAVVVNNRSLRLSEQSQNRFGGGYGEQKTSISSFDRLNPTQWEQTGDKVCAGASTAEDADTAASPLAWYEREAESLWRLVFAHLPRKTLGLSCALVCRSWQRWICDWPALWDDIDVNGRQHLTAEVWKSIGQKRPRFLNLGWTGISNADLLTILEYDDRLETLVLSGCHLSAVTALRRCTSDLLRLDLRYVQGCSDASFKELVLDAPRMKTLQAVFLSGCDVGDATVRLMANQFTRLRSLDLSYCTRVTNLSVEVLAAAGCAARRNLTYLNLSGCPLLLSSIFGPLQRMNALKHLELQACTGIPQLEIDQFEQAYAVAGRPIIVIR